MNNKKKFTRQYAMRDLGVLMLSASATLLAPTILAQSSSEQMEEVVAIGIRHSLEAAADAKRDDARVVDAVVAEDIGKLPDNNIAEALQRVTGVSINRDFGVGSEVSIRGLPQNRVEVNGRSTLGDGRNGVNFQDFPADFLSKVEVIKSPTPEMIEGALGGTISLVTARPLDLNAPLASISVQGEYADKADNWAPIISSSVGDSWDLGEAGTFGAMASLSYQDRTLRRDESLVQLQVGPVDFNNDGTIDAADNAKNTPSGNYVYGREHTYNPRTEERERTAFNVSFQWAPASEQGQFYLDLNATERSGSQGTFSLLHVGGTPVATPGVTYEDGNGQLQNFTYDSIQPLQTAGSSFRNTEAYSHAFGGEWNFTDKLTVSGEYSTAESDSYTPFSEFRFRGTDRALEGDGHADENKWLIPVRFVNSNSGAPVVDFADGYVFTDQQNQAFRRYEDTRTYIVNQEDALRFDLEYAEPFGLEWLSAVKTGVRVTSREYEQNQYQFRITNIFKNLTDADGNPDIIWMEDIAAQFPNAITEYDFSGDGFEHTGMSGAYDLAKVTGYDVGLLQNQQATFDIVKQLLAGTNMQVDGSLSDNLEYQEGAYSAIGEDTSAMYLQANLDFGNVRAVVGGRYVSTDLETSAYQSVDGVYEKVSADTSYNDFLPSLNVTWDVTEDTLMRFAAAKVMRRADFSELSPAYAFRDAYIAASRGNPELEPYRATQYDISAEHYWDGNMVSATLFYKDVASFTERTYECENLPEIVGTLTNTSDFDKICLWQANGIQYANASTPTSAMGILTDRVTNGEDGKVQGLELGYQQAFDFLPGRWSGLGISANYTYADSTTPDGVPMVDISKNTFNTQLYYEYEGFGIRLAYTFRDRFLDEAETKRVLPLGELVEGAGSDDPTLGNDYREDLAQLDLSASYDVTEDITVIANVTNLTAEPTINTGTNGTAFQIMENDRRFVMGVRAKF
ncbi:TonB-dependent receptor [Microbulbifer donghaiensis]|uniref:TonB-dependent receptor n=1 Tax=Microbulbifer donghaiensis TaxID=494016 RepID=A0A1M5F9Y2_9GAMM|nr:TonB-dependent receptor [Microbulbifer donghaiensis]SHF88327.1 TonB-dependent receptor [Microbulbifer donghaiensis]